MARRSIQPAAATLNSRHTEIFASKGISASESQIFDQKFRSPDLVIKGMQQGWRRHHHCEFGMKLAFIIALLLAASPVAAQQVTTANQQQQPLGTSGQTVTSPLTNTGVICQQEMVARSMRGLQPMAVLLEQFLGHGAVALVDRV